MPSFESKEFTKELCKIEVTESQVLKKLKKLNPNKSPGPDGHHSLVSKELAEELAKLLTIVYKNVWLKAQSHKHEKMSM